MANILERLTEGIVNRSVTREGEALLTKWSKTGLLEGLDDDHERQAMAVLLENQAKELLREVNSQGTGGGAVQGFAAVAFPIVRRVFGGLLANKLVSVQPMSLPSGLIFFLDFTRTDNRGADRVGESVHGQGVVGSQITDGVDIGPADSVAGHPSEKGFYNLSQGYSAARSGFATNQTTTVAGISLADLTFALDGTQTAANLSTVRFDPDLENDTSGAIVACVNVDADNLGAVVCSAPIAGVGGHETLAAQGRQDLAQLSRNSLMTLQLDQGGNIGATYDPANNGGGGAVGGSQLLEGFRIVKRLTEATWGPAIAGSPNGELLNLRLVLVEVLGGTSVAGDSATDVTTALPAGGGAQTLAPGAAAVGDQLTGRTVGAAVAQDYSFAIMDNIGEVAGGMGTLQANPLWELESTLASPFANDGMNIPEIDISVDSVAITATTRKLKAKWTPELGQDLNAYHNLDAEVELTSVLSEQIALEIDQEILHDLLSGATAGTMFWSRQPGIFVNRATGADLTAGGVAGPDFTGTVSEWYETLIETVNDISAQIHRKTLRGGANFLVTSPEVANILEFTSGFRASVTHDDDTGQIGGYKDGSINKKWDLYVDPYFPRNIILVGRKGSSFLESGYVYSPYVPLQTTPTIFGPEDFTPRKGVMTRYGKKMVRPDMYGVVVVRDMANG